MEGSVRPTTVIRNTGTSVWVVADGSCVGFGAVCANAGAAKWALHASSTAAMPRCITNLRVHLEQAQGQPSARLYNSSHAASDRAGVRHVDVTDRRSAGSAAHVATRLLPDRRP